MSGGRIFTTDPEQPWAQALVLEGDRITRVGGDKLIAEYADKDIERLDIAGGLVVPGFVDGHVHVGMTGSSMLKAQLQGAGSLQEIQKRVLEWAQANPEAPRVLGACGYPGCHTHAGNAGCCRFRPPRVSGGF